MVKNGRLYYQAYSDQEEEGLCLYAYDPERGNEKMISDIHNLFADCEADSIVFSRADEAGMQTIYRYRDGAEEKVCEGVGRAMADRAADAIYLRQNISEDGGSWELLSRISEDGSVGEILTKEDNAWAAYSGEETGAVYYMCVEADDDNWKLYYYDPQTEEKTCLEKRMEMLGGFLPVTAERKQQGFTEDIIFYYALEGETSWLWMAVGGEPVRLELDSMGDGAASLLEDSEVIGGDVYLALKNYELDTGKLFRLRREAEGWSETCVGEGTAPALERLRGTDGELVADSLFSSDYAWSDEAQEYSNSLWADGKQILDRYTPFGLLCTGQNGTEYYALQDVSAECAPNLMRINTAGGSKVFHEGVALCEAWNGGLLMLADCAAEYPYLGTLYFYDGQQTVQIDTDVTVFYGHDSRRLADGVPYVWDWSGEG